MKNPWLKKNPVLSMWLSGAHRVAGTARGHAVAAMKREAGHASRDATDVATQVVHDYWSTVLGAPPSKSARRVTANGPCIRSGRLAQCKLPRPTTHYFPAYLLINLPSSAGIISGGRTKSTQPVA